MSLTLKIAIGWVLDGLEANHPSYGLVESCRGLMQRDWEIVLSHTCRQGNRVAHWLANFSLDFELGPSIVTDPPDCIRKIQFEDACGVTSPRVISL